MTIRVKKATMTIQTYIDTLAKQYAQIAKVENDLEKKRNNIKKATLTMKELEIKAGKAQARLTADKKKLAVLAETITVKKKLWEQRIDTLNVKILTENKSLKALQAAADQTMKAIFAAIPVIQKKWP